ncbi:MAG: hypothetical protein Q9M36_04385 [Sulfurovum sp.]|nr:hypothetical protein [Sulfurovum sp.]
MNKKEQDIFKEMTINLNTYVKSKEYEYISKIETSLKSFFNATDIKIWYCDRDTGAIRYFTKEKSETLAMDVSLTQKVIESRRGLIENHITSNKYYNPSIDNPFALKVRSLLIFPLVRHKKVIAIVKLWRGMKQRKKFFA